MNQDKFCPVFEKDFCLSSLVGLIDHVGEEEVFDKSWWCQEDAFDNIELDVFEDVSYNLIEKLV